MEKLIAGIRMNREQNHFKIGLGKNPANFIPLSPVSFLERSANVYPNLPSVVYERRIFECPCDGRGSLRGANGVISESLALMKGPRPLVIDVDDAAFSGGRRIGQLEYEDAVMSGDADFMWAHPEP